VRWIGILDHVVLETIVGGGLAVDNGTLDSGSV
jgi:hypothetical protein